ncbi:Cytochrome c2 [compost metagenome]
MSAGEYRMKIAIQAILALSIVPISSTSLADDLSLSERLTKNHCSVCHTFQKDEPNGQGPNLFGIVGRKAGSAPGFSYSQGFILAMRGRVWSSELLDAWLADTQQVAPGNAMTYFQSDAEKRSKIVRYLESLH